MEKLTYGIIRNKQIMKTITCLGILFTFGASAQTINTDEVITAQLSLTKNATQKMIRDFAEQSSDGDYEHADFNKKAKKFSQDLDAAFIEYEQTLKTTILPPFNLYVQEYQKVAKSTIYSPEQKKALLGQILTQLYQQSKNATAKINEALGLVLARIGFDPKYKDLRRLIIKDKFKIGYHDCELIELYRINKDPYFQSCMAPYITPAVQPQLMKDCYSQSCMILSQVMYTKFFSIYVSTFSYSMISISLDETSSIPVWIGTDNINYFSIFLDRFKMPASINSLPFSVSESDLEKINAQAKIDASNAAATARKNLRADYLAQLLAEFKSMGNTADHVNHSSVPKLCSQLKPKALSLMHLAENSTYSGQPEKLSQQEISFDPIFYSETQKVRRQLKHCFNQIFYEYESEN